MIDVVSGRAASVGPNWVVVMVGGVGLRVFVPRTVLETLDGPGHALTLYTHLAVREDALTLYGFNDQDERTLFETLLTVSGIGPRLAIAILSTLSSDQLRSAVGREEPEILTRVPGIGKKVAHKIVFELKDKLVLDTFEGLAAASDLDGDVLATLTALGYSIVEAQAAIQSIPRDAPEELEERVRLALEYFT